MYRDQSALIREESVDLPAGESSTVPRHVTAGGLVCMLVCESISSSRGATEKGLCVFIRVLPVSTLSLEQNELPTGRMKLTYIV